MRGAILVSSLIGAFLLGAVASRLAVRSEPEAIQSELAAELAAIGTFAGALEKLDAGEPDAAARVLELGLSSTSERAAALARKGPALDCATIPNLRHGVNRALRHAEARAIKIEAIENLRALHALCGPPPADG